MLPLIFLRVRHTASLGIMSVSFNSCIRVVGVQRTYDRTYIEVLFRMYGSGHECPNPSPSSDENLQLFPESSTGTVRA